ncbi:MAG: hypothetical protein Q4B42_05815, partial [Oscillospiraceae bacterium]|nr:hypothetical protein [Oscillospiraceae bacterium]
SCSSSLVRPSYPRGVRACDLNSLLPESIAKALREGIGLLGARLKGFGSPEALLTGLETRTSSPLRIVRGEGREAEGAKGVYPCGEGAGYAGGIMSAAVDGIKSALALMEKYRPF